MSGFSESAALLESILKVVNEIDGRLKNSNPKPKEKPSEDGDVEGSLSETSDQKKEASDSQDPELHEKLLNEESGSSTSQLKPEEEKPREVSDAVKSSSKLYKVPSDMVPDYKGISLVKYFRSGAGGKLSSRENPLLSFQERLKDAEGDFCVIDTETSGQNERAFFRLGEEPHSTIDFANSDFSGGDKLRRLM